MEWLLIGTVGVSLALAVAMSIVAWRLLSRDRERSAARIDALEALAFDVEVPSLAHAVEVEHPAGWDAPLHVDAGEPRIEHTQSEKSRPLPVPTLFEAPERRPVTSRRLLAIGSLAVVLVSAVAGAVAMTWSGGEFTAARLLSGLSGESAGVDALPIELLSLRHTADPRGMFSVTGLVQNPANGQDLEQLDAVLYLFDETGQFFTSGRAPLDTPQLAAGDDAAFVVRIPTSAKVTRYRLGFKKADGRAVAHVDHRGQLPDGTTEDVMDDAADVIAPAIAARPSDAARTASRVR